jgi:hypothetical protein
MSGRTNVVLAGVLAMAALATTVPVSAGEVVEYRGQVDDLGSAQLDLEVNDVHIITSTAGVGIEVSVDLSSIIPTTDNSVEETCDRLQVRALGANLGPFDAASTREQTIRLEVEATEGFAIGRCRDARDFDNVTQPVILDLRINDDQVDGFVNKPRGGSYHFTIPRTAGGGQNLPTSPGAPLSPEVLDALLGDIAGVRATSSTLLARAECDAAGSRCAAAAAARVAMQAEFRNDFTRHPEALVAIEIATFWATLRDPSGRHVVPGMVRMMPIIARLAAAAESTDDQRAANALTQLVVFTLAVTAGRG